MRANTNLRRMSVVAAAMAVVLTACGSGDGPSATATTTASGDLGTAAATTTTTGSLRTFTIGGSGDILLHYTLAQEAKARGGDHYAFDESFDEMRGRISGTDLAICHMETPISPDDNDLTPPKVKIFNVPFEIAPALKAAGFKACDTASNHTWDRALPGVKATLEKLDAAGIGHSGSSLSQAEADNPPIYDVKGVKVGHLAFSYAISNDGKPRTHVPAEAPWLKTMLWSVIGADGILAQAHKIKARGAEFVVVSIHWGDEYSHKPNAEQKDIAKKLLASPDVDLILGDHVHVVQPCETINGKYVLYGMGNFLSNQAYVMDDSLKDDNEDGTWNKFTVTETSPGKFETTSFVYTPTWVAIPGHHIMPATPQAFPQSYKRTVDVMGSLGAGKCAGKPEF